MVFALCTLQLPSFLLQARRSYRVHISGLVLQLGILGTNTIVVDLVHA